MSFFAFTLISPGYRKLFAFNFIFWLYALLSFLYVIGYMAGQIRNRHLLRNENSPILFIIPGFSGFILIIGVLALLYMQYPYWMILAVLGVGALMVFNGRTAQEQFGLVRLSLAKLVAWSLLVCGAVVFIEIPLSKGMEDILTALRLEHPQQESVETFRQLNEPLQILAFMLLAVVISPMIEEIFFRGFMLTFLRNYTSPLVAVFLSGGIFALAHANLDSAIPLWFLGVVLGIAYQHTGSLLLPIGIHACWNFFTALNLLLEKGNG